MTMTAEEIVRHYAQAKDKAKDIKVLAELNCVTQKEIQTVLAEAGIECAERTKRRSFANQFQKLYDKGLSDREIREEVGCSLSSVVKWREKQHLPPNVGQAELEPSADAPALPEVYGHIEEILAALPAGASRQVRQQAGYLLSNLIWEYLEDRLELKEGQIGGNSGTTDIF